MIRLFALLHTITSFTFSFIAFAQENNFRSIPSPEGTSWGLVTSIAQDAQENMWLAGSSGLYKYDGNSFTHYLPDPLKKGSISSFTQNAVCAARNGYIWIGSPAGLDRFDPATGIFTNFRNKPGDTTSLPHDYVNVILEDHEGIIWIGTGVGLCRFNEKTQNFTNYYYNPSDTTSLSSNTIVVLYEDKQGVLWIGTGSPFIESKEGGLNRMDRKTGKFTRYHHKTNDVTTLTDDRVSAIFEDSHGIFWVGTCGDGLHILDRATGVFTRLQYDHANPDKLSRSPVVNNTSFDDQITFIHEDMNGIIWIGTLLGGLTKYDPEKKELIHYNSGKNNITSWKDKMFWRCYTSKDGILWMSTWEGNLFQVDPYRKGFPFFPMNFPVHCLLAEFPGILWLGSSQGLIRKDLANNDQKIFKKDPRNPHSISNDTVHCILRDSNRDLWIGTPSGLNRFDPDKNNFTVYKRDEKNQESLNSDTVLFLYEDRNKNFWVGTWNGGLNLMNRKTGTFTHFNYSAFDTSSLKSDAVTVIFEDNKERLWIGTWFTGGINLMNRKTGKFQRYLVSANISSILQDKNGTLWVGTESGLYNLDEKSGNFNVFSEPNSGKKFANAVLCILEDARGNLWVRTQKDIVSISNSRNEIKSFGKDFGVKISLQMIGDITKSQNGNIILSAHDGYYSFFPDQISTNPNLPRLSITELRVQDQPIKPGINSILNTPLSETKKIRLNHAQNTFSFDFKAIDYSSVGNNQFIFMLENYDREWRTAGAERTANYYNIPPGEYIFHVKVSSDEGRWVEKNISILITPPWWRTWWAYIAYALLLAAIVYRVHRYQKARVLRAERERTREKALAHAREIEKAYSELKSTQAQLVQSEKMASLGELTAGIAHEIQNPLNFVNNFSEVNKELADELKEKISQLNISEKEKKEITAIADDVVQNEEKIAHHGKRADSIVKGMLQHSRASTGLKEQTDINALADEYLRLSYHGMRAKDKSFNAIMQTDFDKYIGNISIIPQDIGRVMLNLYNNAFHSMMEKKKSAFAKAEADEYELTLLVVTRKLDGKVIITVKDNGTGIPEKVKDKIFQPFFTTKPAGSGTGLGLSLSYDIVTKEHSGEIKVESKEGEGAEFVIILPL